MPNLSTEPAVIIGAVTGVVEAGIALAIAFGLELSPEQIAGIIGGVAALGAMVQAVFTRNIVFSPASMEFARTHPRHMWDGTGEQG